MKAIIIAGGLGTRLRPLTYNTPKVIVPVANIPFILHQIELIKKYGIKEIILNLHYLSNNIKRIIKQKVRGVKIRYSIEEIPLGTCGAVKNAQEFFDDEPLLIFNGDILTDLNLKELIAFHRSKRSQATLTLTRVEDPTTYGLILMGKNMLIKEFLEKPSWEMVTTDTVNAGIYVIEPKLFREVPFGIEYSFERDFFPKILNEGKPMYGFASEAYWIDIGSPQKYMQAHKSILLGEVDVRIPGKQVKKMVWVDSGAVIDKKAKVFGPGIIGKDCRVKAEAVLGAFTVLGERVTVSEGANIANSIIWAGTKIGKDVELNDCIIGNDCRIEAGVSLSGGAVIADGAIVSKGTKIGTKF